MSDIYSFTARTIDGESVSLEGYRGKVLLIVNTASRCGFTPQYQVLERLYRSLKDQGFMILGFPCNQFGQQEPDSNEAIKSFCALNYGVSFPMFEKTDVNGADAHPLFRQLTAEAPGLLGTKAIKWNFTKFLVDQNGIVCRRYAPITNPEVIRADIETLLKAH